MANGVGFQGGFDYQPQQMGQPSAYQVDAYLKFLQSFNPNAQGMDLIKAINPLKMTAIGFGADLLTGGLSYLAGSGERRELNQARKGAKRDLAADRGAIQKELDAPGLDAYATDAAVGGAQKLAARQVGDQIDDSLGLDTGLGAGALFQQAFIPRTMQLGQNIGEYGMFNKSRRAAFLQALLGESASRYGSLFGGS